MCTGYTPTFERKERKPPFVTSTDFKAEVKLTV